MKLYYHPFSANARRVTMTAEILGSPVEKVLVDLMKGAHKAPDYLAINPNGKVPALVDGDLKLWESHAIMVHLSEQSLNQTIWPTDSRIRTEVLRWMFWSASHWTPTIGVMLYENVLKANFEKAPPDAARIAKGNADFEVLAKVADAHLDGRKYLVGDDITLADISVAAPLMHMESAKFSIEKFAHLKAWFARIQEHEAWKKSAT